MLPSVPDSAQFSRKQAFITLVIDPVLLCVSTHHFLTDMVAATHAVVHDDRNDSVLIGMRDGLTGEFTLVPRDQARVSVLDSAFMLGDGIWEGIRAKRGVVQFAKDHMNRLFESAKAMCESTVEPDAVEMC